MAGAVIDLGEDELTSEPLLPTEAKQETIRDLHISPNLTTSERRDMERLVGHFDQVFTDRPGLTN